MIQIVVRRRLSCWVAGSERKQLKRKDTGHRWRDKSADVRRAHVVGWFEDLQRSRMWSAGAFDEIAKQIKRSSAIADLQTISGSP
uniref:Uncharacterized protein n=1 Tax=Rhodopseudomonas palustris (strain BisA53) TaxID=316055 RepID=Q07JD0_RHOP5